MQHKNHKQESPKSGESTPMGSSTQVSHSNNKIGRKNSGKSEGSNSGKIKVISPHASEKEITTFVEPDQNI